MPKQLARFKAFEDMSPDFACCSGLIGWLAAQPKTFHVDPSRIKIYPAGEFNCPACKHIKPEITAVYIYEKNAFVPVEAIEIDEGSEAHADA